jgi:hypothetical protein
MKPQAVKIHEEGNVHSYIESYGDVEKAFRRRIHL